MKRILFACFLATASITGTMAQSAQTTVAPQPDNKALLSSKLTEMEAASSRGRQDYLVAQFSEAAALMSTHMAAVHQEMTAANGGKKEELKKKLDTLQALYNEAKMLSADVKKNDKELVAKVKAFVQNY